MYTYFWDIETSKIKCDNGEYMQVTYLSNVLKMNYITGELVQSLFFRTIEETVEHFKTLEHCTVWAHNLDYELTFLLRDIGETKGTVKYNKNGVVEGIYDEQVQNIILRDKHSPLSINLDYLPHITFRDSYALFNKSVATLGKELGIPKLEYNYKVVRLPWDKLTQLDYDYNERDNVIVAKAIYKYMQDNGFNFEDIPLTFTSFVKLKRKEFIVNNFSKKALNKFYFDRNEQVKDFSYFELMLKTYQGGLTTSNINETGKLIDKGVYSIDIKSSYPYQMCSRYFPFYSEKHTKHYVGTLADKYFKLGNYKGFYGYFKFKNIRVKNRNYLLPISSSQLAKGFVSDDRVLFNGKLLSANEIMLPCNEIDVDTINLVYNYDMIECVEIYATNKQRRLRHEETSFLLSSFYKKETIKDKTDLEYALAKVYINSMYGVKVTAPIKNSYIIENGEINETDYFKFNQDKRKDIYDKFIENQKAFGGTLDIFSDGCYITSFARFMLVQMIVKLVNAKCNVVYSDTDSIKFYLNGNSEQHIMKIISLENIKIVRGNKNNPRFIKFKEDNNISEEHYNKICNLGIWELETVDDNDNPKPIPYFITYGAKKYGYITSDDEVVTTIAGCNKKNPPTVIKNLAERENISLLESFKIVLSLGTQFDESASGRTVAKVENRIREDMEFLTYKGIPIKQYGGIIIEETTYTLNVSLSDSNLLGFNRPNDYIIKINIEGVIDYE